MDQYNESLSVDRVMYSQDIKGSIAYARANVKTGILTQEEFDTIEKGLGEIMKEWEEGKFVSRPGDEGKQASEYEMPIGVFVCPIEQFLSKSIANWDGKERYPHSQRTPPR